MEKGERHVEGQSRRQKGKVFQTGQQSRHQDQDNGDAQQLLRSREIGPLVFPADRSNQAVCRQCREQGAGDQVDFQVGDEISGPLETGDIGNVIATVQGHVAEPGKQGDEQGRCEQPIQSATTPAGFHRCPPFQPPGSWPGA